MSPLAKYSSLRRKPKPRCGSRFDEYTTLDSGLRRKDELEFILCPNIFEHTPKIIWPDCNRQPAMATDDGNRIFMPLYLCPSEMQIQEDTGRAARPAPPSVALFDILCGEIFVLAICRLVTLLPVTVLPVTVLIETPY